MQVNDNDHDQIELLKSYRAILSECLKQLSILQSQPHPQEILDIVLKLRKNISIIKQNLQLSNVQFDDSTEDHPKQPELALWTIARYQKELLTLKSQLHETRIEKATVGAAKSWLLLRKEEDILEQIEHLSSLIHQLEANS